MARVRVGVIGAGWWATQAHLPALVAHPRCDVTALADPHPDRLATAADAFDVTARFGSTDELVRADLVDAVVIATPHAQHYEAARTALDAGLHVLVEKPMTLRAVEAWDLVARADSKRLHLVVGYTHQFTSHARLLRQTLRRQHIGQLKLVTGIYASVMQDLLRGQTQQSPGALGCTVASPMAGTYADPSLSGGGQAQAQMTHPVAMMLFATDACPVAVSAFMDDLDLRVDVVDAVSFRLDGGVIGTMASTGTVHRGGGSQLVIHYYGTHGEIAQDLGSGTLAVWREGNLITSVTDAQVDQQDRVGAPARCLVDLAAGVIAAEDNPGPGTAAARAVEFLEAAYVSAASGGRSVTVPQRRPRGDDGHMAASTT